MLNTININGYDYELEELETSLEEMELNGYGEADWSLVEDSDDWSHLA